MEAWWLRGLTLRTNSETRLPSFFYRLSSRAQRTYLKSDAVERFDFVANAAARNSLYALMRRSKPAISLRTATCARALTAEVCRGSATAPVIVEVRSVRPRNTRGELHGLFIHMIWGSARPAIVLGCARRSATRSSSRRPSCAR